MRNFDTRAAIQEILFAAAHCGETERAVREASAGHHMDDGWYETPPAQLLYRERRIARARLAKALKPWKSGAQDPVRAFIEEHAA